MRCEVVRDCLDDLVDGTLTGDDAAKLRAHLELCPECLREERELRALVAAARELPRELGPSRDLWPGIANRINRPSFFGARWGLLQWSLATAAAVLLVVSGLLLRSTRQDERPAVATATTSGASMQPVSTFTASALESSEGEFERASAELLELLESRRESLPPNTIEDLKHHLTAIDVALDEIRAVLKDNPGNAEATRLLASTQRRKVDVLKRVVGMTRI